VFGLLFNFNLVLDDLGNGNGEESKSEGAVVFSVLVGFVGNIVDHRLEFHLLLFFVFGIFIIFLLFIFGSLSGGGLFGFVFCHFFGFDFFGVFLVDFFLFGLLKVFSPDFELFGVEFFLFIGVVHLLLMRFNFDLVFDDLRRAFSESQSLTSISSQ